MDDLTEGEREGLIRRFRPGHSPQGPNKLMQKLVVLGLAESYVIPQRYWELTQKGKKLRDQLLEEVGG